MRIIQNTLYYFSFLNLNNLEIINKYYLTDVLDILDDSNKNHKNNYFNKYYLFYSDALVS